MEGAIELKSPLWVGAKLIWADTIDRTGSDYDGWIVSLDTRTGHRTRVPVRNAYIESLARAGDRLAVRYVLTDATGRAIGPDPSRERVGAFGLSQLGA